MSNDHYPSFTYSRTINDIEARLDQAWTHINQKNVTKAQAACTKINVDFPNSADGWYATSFLAFQLKQATLALECIEKSLQLAPDNPQWQCQKIKTLLLIPDKLSAQQAAAKMVNKNYQQADTCAQWALLFSQLNDFEQAQFYYRQAISLTDEKNNPQQAGQLYFNLASIERFQGKLKQAEQHLNLAISLNNKDYEAYLLRSSLKKQSPKANHLPQLKQALANNIKHPIAKAQVLYALAKEHEDLASVDKNHYTLSFNYLKQAANTRRTGMRYEVKQDLSTLKAIVKNFTREIFQPENRPLPQNTNNEAIFILGLPRTGSTLVERIISNHQEVFSAGELNNFALTMMAETKKISPTAPPSREELVSLTRQIDFHALGQAYINSTRPDTGHSAHFIDKLPLNSLYVGLIHLALPKAKIIYVTRHPLDTCYSIYKQLFTHGYPFSYDLTELAQYYIEHHKLMQHWLSVMPGVIHQVAYEDLITDITAEAKKLIDYCQLPWQTACSDFQENTAPSTTASASQVREKIYQSSKGKWRHFEQELMLIKKLLEQAGICCD